MIMVVGFPSTVESRVFLAKSISPRRKLLPSSLYNLFFTSRIFLPSFVAQSTKNGQLLEGGLRQPCPRI